MYNFLCLVPVNILYAQSHLLNEEFHYVWYQYHLNAPQNKISSRLQYYECTRNETVKHQVQESGVTILCLLLAFLKRKAMLCKFDTYFSTVYSQPIFKLNWTLSIFNSGTETHKTKFSSIMDDQVLLLFSSFFSSTMNKDWWQRLAASSKNFTPN